MPTRDRIPSGGRFNACVILGVGVVLFVFEAGFRLAWHRYYPFVWLFAPGLIILGIAGLIEPRIVLAVSPEAKELDLPRWARLLGPALVAVGFAVGWWLMHRMFED